MAFLLPKPRPFVLSRMEQQREANNEYVRNSKLARERDGHRCRVCGGERQLETHHLVPRSLSGKKTKHLRSNLVTLCGGSGSSCHVQVTRHLVRLEAMTDRGADGPIRVLKHSGGEQGYVVITEAA